MLLNSSCSNARKIFSANKIPLAGGVFLYTSELICSRWSAGLFSSRYEELGLPDFLGVALRKADIAAVLLAFTGDVAFLHDLKFL
jgi:hypothetical protein